MKKILFAASESVPFIKTGGLADVVGSLPKYFDKEKYDVRVMLPKYLCIKEEWRNQMQYRTHFYMDLNWRTEYVGILELEYEGITFYFIDNEDLFFPKTDPNYIYASPRTREEAEKMLFHAIKVHENFVFAAVKGDYGEAIYPFFQYAVLIDTPKDIRVQRVKKRSFQKFGNRMLPGGDLHEQEEKFFEFVTSRPESTVEEWIQLLSCPILRIDGTKPVEENVDFIINQI